MRDIFNIKDWNWYRSRYFYETRKVHCFCPFSCAYECCFIWSKEITKAKYKLIPHESIVPTTLKHSKCIIFCFLFCMWQPWSSINNLQKITLNGMLVYLLLTNPCRSKNALPGCISLHTSFLCWIDEIRLWTFFIKKEYSSLLLFFFSWRADESASM